MKSFLYGSHYLQAVQFPFILTANQTKKLYQSIGWILKTLAYNAAMG